VKCFLDKSNPSGRERKEGPFLTEMCFRFPSFFTVTRILLTVHAESKIF
jgi:hypothetical protein